MQFKYKLYLNDTNFLIERRKIPDYNLNFRNENTQLKDFKYWFREIKRRN